MADKHEVAPTAKKPPGEFRETIKLGSASAWDKVTLELFRVVFNKTEYTELQGSNYVDKRYFETPAEGEECYDGGSISYQFNGRLYRNHAVIRGCE
jgi:hypothetical protein